MTLTRLAALTRQWRVMPPAALQLSRIARYLGLPPMDSAAPTKRSAQTLESVLDQAQQAGIPITANGLPDDPMLKFLNDDIGLGQSLPS